MLVTSMSDSINGHTKIKKEEVMWGRDLRRGRKGDAIGKDKGRSGRSGQDMNRGRS